MKTRRTFRTAFTLLGESYRGMSVRLAECPLYQWFCELDRLDVVRVPSKSELCRFVEIVDEAVLRRVNEALIGLVAKPADDGGEQALQLKNEIEPSSKMG